MSKSHNFDGQTSPERREILNAGPKFEYRVNPEVYSTLFARKSAIDKAVEHMARLTEVHPDPEPDTLTEQQPIISGTDSRLDRAGGSLTALPNNDPLKANPASKTTQSSPTASTNDNNHSENLAGDLEGIRYLIDQLAVPGVMAGQIPEDVFNAIHLTSSEDLSRGA